MSDPAPAATRVFDDGELITSWSRGPNREFRMHLQEYRGHQFVRLSEWAVNPHNSQWFPSKDDKGRPRLFTIKIRELEDVAAALRAVKLRLENSSTD